jgi:hypothetical protein
MARRLAALIALQPSFPLALDQTAYLCEKVVTFQQTHVENSEGGFPALLCIAGSGSTNCSQYGIEVIFGFWKALTQEHRPLISVEIFKVPV